MGKSHSYKLRTKAGKTIGPVSLAEIAKLIAAKKIHGDEKACRLPNAKWKNFGAFPELADLILNSIQKNSGVENSDANELATPAVESTELKAADEPENTNEEPVENRTATLMLPEDEPSFAHAESPQNPEQKNTKKADPEVPAPNPFGDVPTLVNIERKVNPDLEKTKVIQVSETYRADIQEYVEDATKVIALNQQTPIQAEKGTQVPIVKTLGLQVKKNILSKRVIYILVVGLMASFYFTQKEEEKKDLVRDLSPKTYKFKAVQVNAPAVKDKKKVDIARSAAYLNKGIRAFAKDAPLAYVAASKELYKSVFLNPDNIVARSLLASTYIRLSEVIPRDQRLFEAVSKLLELSPKEQRLPKPVPYLVAQSEFLRMLEQQDRALLIINEAVKKNPHPDLLAEQAALYRLNGERNKALTLITESLKMQGSRRNPRHLLLYAQLLEEKDKRGAAVEVLKSFLKTNQLHGEGLYHYARVLYKLGDFTKAIKTLIVLINDPKRADKLTLANAFMLAARIYEAKKMWSQALKFVKAAKRILPENQEADDLLLRIRSNNPEKEKLYARLLNAREKEQSREHQEAINLYTRARETDRSSPLPLFYLARLYEELGKPQKAINLYELTTKMARKHPDSFFRLADLYIDRYELNKAKFLMNTIKRASVNSGRVTHMLGKIALQEGDIGNARANFLAAVESGSRVSELYVDLGNLEDERKERDLAEFYYSVALRYEPFNEDALLGIALARFYKNTPSDAVKFLEAKLSARPNSPAVMTNLALIHLRSGDKQLGKQYLQKAVRNNPRYARAYKLMGDLVKEEGDRQTDFQEKRRSFKFALASYGAYSKLAPNEPDGYMAAAELYFYVRDLGAAAKNYHQVLSLAPNYPRARLQLAKIARNGQDNDGAMSFVEEEIKRHPNSSAAYVELGKIHIVKAEYSLASKALTTAARLDSKNTDAIIHLGYVHYLQNDYKSAIALFERALEIDPLKADIHWKIGLAYEKEGNKKRAIASYRNFRGLITDPTNIEKVKQRIIKLQRELAP